MSVSAKFLFLVKGTLPQKYMLFFWFVPAEKNTLKIFAILFVSKL